MKAVDILQDVVTGAVAVTMVEQIGDLKRVAVQNATLCFDSENRLLVTGLPSGDSGGGPPRTSTLPKMDGEAALGGEHAYSPGGHVHPHDTTRVSRSDFVAHTSDKANPHGVTPKQIGTISEAAIDEKLRSAQITAMALVGVVSTTDPITGLGLVPNRVTKNYWLRSGVAEMPGEFPLAVLDWDFSTESWVEAAYSPNQLDLWMNVNAEPGKDAVYRFLTEWRSFGSGIDLASYLTSQQVDALRDNKSIVLDDDDKWSVNPDAIRGRAVFGDSTPVATINVDPNRPYKAFLFNVSGVSVTVNIAPFVSNGQKFIDFEIWIGTDQGCEVVWPVDIHWDADSQGQNELKPNTMNMFVIRDVGGQIRIANKAVEVTL